MIKKQTFIAFFVDASGRELDFERFCCKKVATVQGYIKQLWDMPLYRACTKGAEAVKIYATPDGVNRETLPVFTMELETI